MKKKVKLTLDSEVDEVIDSIRKLLVRVNQLVIFRGVLQDPVVVALIDCLGGMVTNRLHSTKIFSRVARNYASFFAGLVSEVEFGQESYMGTPWQNHLLNVILHDENLFSRKAECNRMNELGKSLIFQVEEDLARLQELFFLKSEQVRTMFQVLGWEIAWPGWDRFQEKEVTSSEASGHLSMKQLLTQTAEWRPLVPELAAFYTQQGAGIFAKFRAFCWKPRLGGGFLQGISIPDPILMDDLVGLEDQKEWMIRNTSYFLAGYPANNILVCGDRGTGKSSSIKALLNHFTHQFLRMVEISRDDLNDLPEVMKLLRKRKQFFIVFIDDLSFEEGETKYKTLKAVLEGSLESRPPNILVYATSNRRHLISEFFSDRNGLRSDEIRVQDTLQEKVSLADRFGIQLVFVALDQRQYLNIVHSMCEKRGLKLPQQDLERRALEWTQFYNVRSGRTARQFTDYLSAELLTGSLEE